MKNVYQLIGFFILLSLLLGCRMILKKISNTVEYKPTIFKSIALNNNDENVCSPSKPEYGLMEDFSVLKINAPSEIIFNVKESNVPVPVCGFFMVEMTKASDIAMKLNIKSLDTGIVLSGFKIDKEPNLVAPEPEPTFVEREPKDDLAGTYFGSYFNIDLRQYVEFPLIPGEYELSAEYSGLVSNVCTVKVSIK